MNIVWIALGAVGFLLLLFLYLICPSLRRHPHRALLEGRYIAHRGLHDLPACPGIQRSRAPENSLAALEEAVRAGYMIETDIHITADNRVVVFHDDSLRRLCGVEGTPESMTLSQLKALHLGGTDETVPTLEELLTLVQGRVPLLIEFKCTDIPTCRRLCETAAPILDVYPGVYLVQSFFPFVLSWYRRHRRNVCRGQLSAGFYHDTWYMKLAGCLLFNFVSRPDFVSYDHRHARHVCRRLCTALGAYPVAWTIHTQAELDDARAWFRTFIFEGFVPRA